MESAPPADAAREPSPVVASLDNCTRSHPDSADDRALCRDTTARNAFLALATAEEALFAADGAYTDSYRILASIAGLVPDAEVCYGAIETYVRPGTDVPGFRVAVTYRGGGSPVYLYDSARPGRTLTTPDMDVECVPVPGGSLDQAADGSEGKSRLGSGTLP
ncbi:MAG: hypothetical protein LBG06_05910, partial [Deltaproteobacteria bacterium]|nr:hypothetical protein [Deltaproteobacteria bacterium]